MKKTLRTKGGFTLIELMIAMFVIGVLAAIVIPAFSKYMRKTRATTFTRDVRTLAYAGMQYALESGWYVSDTSSGVFPTELEGYFSKQKFELGTSLGGVWDFEQDDLGDFTSAVGVDGPTESEEVFQLVDRHIDDGNLSTGAFRKVGDSRYYFIIED